MLSRRGVLVAGMAALLAGCGKSPPSGGGKPVVASSIFPLHDLVRRVGGDALHAALILTAGQSEHGFNPSPQLAKTVAGAKSAFLIGLELDEWAAKLIESAGSGIPIVRIGERVKTRTFEIDSVGGHRRQAEPTHDEHHAHEKHGHDHHDHDHHDHEEHAHHGHSDHGRDQHRHADHGDAAARAEHQGHHHPSGPDPHFWLSVPSAIAMTGIIRESLSQALPEHAAAFEARAKALTGELATLDAEIRNKVKSFKNKRLVTFHGSFNYFALEYGLEVVAVIEPFPGKQPSAAYLKDVLVALKGKSVAAIFTEPQLDKRPAEVLAKEASLPLRELDPLGGVAGRETYASLMRFNLSQLAEAMG